jgi:hypothetical protein
VLNERCRVFLDLAEILSDSVADLKMSTITWIIIVLIIISILVTVTEVGLRFGILAKEKARRDREEGPAGEGGVARVELRGGVGGNYGRTNYSLEELRAWAQALDEREKAAVCGSQYVGKTWAGV